MDNRKPKQTTLLLCIFFGWFGAHRYYVEKWPTAILYTVTLGLAFVGWIVDIFMIASDQFTDGAGQPLLRANGQPAVPVQPMRPMPQQPVRPMPQQPVRTMPQQPQGTRFTPPVTPVQPVRTTPVTPAPQPAQKMVTRFYTCPFCGKAQAQYIAENKTFAFCGKCGQRIDLTLKGPEPKKGEHPMTFTVGAYNGTDSFIFISYAHRNSDKVIPIIAKMQADGYRVWFDEGIDPGTEWDANIANHVRSCDLMIAFISKEYLDSENCKDELNFARDLGKNRILIYLESVELPDGMAMRLNRLQAIHQYKYEDQKDFYEKLYNSPDMQSLR